jgi:hypothetical protein
MNEENSSIHKESKKLIQILEETEIDTVSESWEYFPISDHGVYDGLYGDRKTRNFLEDGPKKTFKRFGNQLHYHSDMDNHVEEIKGLGAVVGLLSAVPVGISSAMMLEHFYQESSIPQLVAMGIFSAAFNPFLMEYGIRMISYSYDLANNAVYRSRNQKRSKQREKPDSKGK